MNNNIICTDETNAVVVKITGAAFENLKRITDIFNKWNDTRMTPAEFLFENEIETNEQLMTLENPNPGGYETTLPGMVCEMYSDAPTVNHLRKAFTDAGFSVSC